MAVGKLDNKHHKLIIEAPHILYKAKHHIHTVPCGCGVINN